MAMISRRRELIKEHYRLQKDIKDIQAELDKLERSNKMLQVQNSNLREVIFGGFRAELEFGDDISFVKPPNHREKSNDDNILGKISQAIFVGNSKRDDFFGYAKSAMDYVANSINPPKSIFASIGELRRTISDDEATVASDSYSLEDTNTPSEHLS